ncbi:hypothetical protein [Asticcacaulis sp. YBE204]|uniref:hypothetical protein n=1 Tax=Asticcacaulis sp. YBE204 TaxID=1282363 RepID=UPI0003C3D8DF|nr:hypothetical protein [Asticcacaulis sp. YBE204]ESQ78364.1 hypothetical protein AEYBE204_14425 [Asticcacaulis sp. YBE204]
MFKPLSMSIVLTGVAGSVAAVCPGDYNGAPPLPAVTHVEFYNPAAPSKPLPAVANNETDRMQVTGGVVGKGSVTLVVTLSADIAMDCELNFQLFDAGTSINGQRQEETDMVFPMGHPSVGARWYLRATATGTNKVKVTLPVAIRLGNSAIHRHRIGLSSLHVGHTPETPQTFEFRNNPIRIKEIRRISPAGAAVSDGQRVELAVYLEEPLDTMTYAYKLKRPGSRATEYTDNALRIQYTISPSDAAYVPPRGTPDYLYFRPEFADGSSRTGLMIDLPDAPATKDLKKKAETPTPVPGRLILAKPAQSTTITFTAQLSTHHTGPGGPTLTLQIPVN